MFGDQMLSAAIVVVGLLGLQGPPGTPESQIESRLGKQLEYEVLVHGLEGTSSPIHVAIYWEPNRIALCSGDIKICSRYFITAEGFEKIGGWRIPADLSGKSNLELLQVYVNRLEDAWPRGANISALLRSQKPLNGQEVVGIPRAGRVWEAQIRVRKRPEILLEYQRLKPPSLGKLTEWIRKELSESDYGYESAIIGCYKDTDPRIWILAEGRSIRVVFSIAWYEDLQRWEHASYLTSLQNLERTTELAERIKARSCARVEFR